MKARALLVALAGLALIPGAARAIVPAAAPPTPGALYRDGQTGRYLLGGAWLFQADPGNIGLARGWQHSSATTGWTAVRIPNAWNAGNYSAASMLGGIGWYRRDFTLPAGAFPKYVPASSQRWIVRFESVNYHATVWLNGRLLGTHTGAYLPFEFDLAHLHSGVNHLVVRVDSVHGPGDMPGGPENGWWNFGGLLREVYLRSVAEADIAQVQVRTLQSCFTSRCPATIDEVVTVRNPTAKPQQVSLAGHYGSLPLSFGAARKLAAGAMWMAHARATLTHPQLWAPGHPYLYRAVLTLSDAQGRALGGYVTYSGVRTVARTPAGRLTLNGRLLDLRGVNLHEQDPSEGAAISTAEITHLIDSARLLGATLVRAHYPLNPQLEELADRDGLLVWSEIPAYGDNRFLGDPAWRRKAYAVLAANIATNQNHPSVLLWSIGNEPPTPATSGERVYIAAATALAHQLDPTRPVGIALSTWPGLACQPAYAPLDVLGVNDYFGWYDAGGGGTDDRDALSSFLDSFRACYPTQAVMITEFGFEANRPGPIEERGTYAFQAQSAAFHLDVFATKRWLSGALYFALQDFAVTPGWAGGNPWPDPPFLHKGLLDLSGAPKLAFGVVARLFHKTVQIAPAHST